MAMAQMAFRRRQKRETPKKPVADLNRLEVFSVSDFCFVGLCLTVFCNFFCGFNRFGFVLYGLFGLQLTLGFISWTCWRPPAIRTASHCWVFLSHTRLVHQQYPAFFFSQISGIGHTCLAPYRSVRISSIVECLQLTVSAAQRLDVWLSHWISHRHPYANHTPHIFRHISGFVRTCFRHLPYFFQLCLCRSTLYMMVHVWNGTIGRAAECPEMALFLWSQCQFG